MAKGTLHLNVEFSAVTDEEGKFGRLAKLLGLADAAHALGMCTRLWLACTRRGEAELPQWLVEQILGERGPEALVEAELASWSAGRGDSKTRRLRIAGAAKHCLWMSSSNDQLKQEQRRKGGESRAKTSSRQLDGTFAPGPADHPAPSSSSEISSASASDQDLGDAPASPPLITEPSGPDPLTLQPSPAKPPRPAKATKHRLPATWSPRPQERERAAREGINVELEAERFRDHHTARANTMADWDAAFRTWLGNAPRFAAGTQHGQRAGPPPREPEQPRKIPTLVR